MATENDKKSKPAAAGSKKAPTKKKGDDASDAEAAAPAKLPPRLRESFRNEVRAKFAEKFGVANPMAMPRLEKVVLNVNIGRHLEGTKVPPEKKQQVMDTLVKVSGQRPVLIRAKKSVSNFKLREGYESSYMVTLRRDRMWHFLDRLIHLATPRIKDFRGLNDKAFDRQGNYSMGLTEQGVFPEINMAEANFTHGMHINVCFSNSTPEKSKFVLEQLGMPFRKPDQK